MATSTNHAIRGTPAYMAPEQWANQPTFASDQYALAIMSYELFTSHPPFRGLPMHVMVAHMQAQPASVCDHNGLLSPTIDAVLQRALAKHPEERFLSIAAFAQALHDALEEHSDQHTSLLQTSPLLSPDASDGDTIVRRFQSSQSLASSSTFPQSQEASIRSATRATPQQIPIMRDPMMHSPVVSQDADVSLQSLVPSSRAQRRRSPLIIGIVVLLSLVLLGGASLSIFHVFSTQQQTQNQRKIAVQAHLITTISARGTATARALATGKVWRAQPIPSASNLSAVTWGAAQFVAVGNNSGGGGAILTSPNGRDWTDRSTSLTPDLSAVTWGDAQFVAVGESSGGGGAILTSPDGRTWTAQPLPPVTNLLGVTWGDAQFVVVGDREVYTTGSTNGIILTSPDGRTWTLRSTSSTPGLSAVTWGGGQFVAVGDRVVMGNSGISSATGEILTSPNGRDWTTRPVPSTTRLSGVTWGDSQFVAVGDRAGEKPQGNADTIGPKTGTLLTSPNGQDWTTQSLSSTTELSGVTWGDSQFVAVGDRENYTAGTLLTSPDGRIWTIQSTPPTSGLSGVAWGDVQFIAVGGITTNNGSIPEIGALLTSP